ncbi:MAG: family 14 glycosylhydrolase [Chthonomonadales bacterium]|nr:family 14 glycosylhydrolase [Chthonomonadales bacterium]
MKQLRVLAFAACLAATAAHTRPSTSVDGAAWTADGGGQERGIRPLSGSDGVTAMVERGGCPCLADRPGTQPPSTYLYFDVEDARARGVRGPVYVTVEYWDDMPGGAITLEYDGAGPDDIASRYRAAEERAGGWTGGARRWRTACFRLDRPMFANRQNTGADFRLGGARLFVQAVRLSRARPAVWARAARIAIVDLKPLVKIGPGGQLIVGGFDPARASDAAPQAAALEAAVPALKQLGVTSHEGYVRWNLCEPEPGRYDWSAYDRYAAVYRKYGLKWVPFLIVGSPYSLPDWFYKKRDAGYQGYVCLEHGQESDVQSLWNPRLREHVARFIRAFCEHYRDTGVVESILLGVTGNYGEAIYPATGNDWTADIHGQYHTHAGYWAGDPFAVASFRVWLGRKYGGSGPLRDAWGERAPVIDQVKPFLRENAPNERAWLDLCDWYIGSMTEWSRFWMGQTREHFPKGDIYLCTGGHAPAEHGSDFGDQCRIAAAVGGGVRITNEASDYRGNFSLTRWVASAGQQYGAYYSFEPAGEVNEPGVIARIYNATASGARGLHYYFPNLFGSEGARANFVRWGAEFRQRKPVVEIAVYYPETHVRLNGNDFLPLVQPLRDRFDFDYMSDQQILDGGLKRVKALLLMHGNVSEAPVWEAIAAWERAGGLVVHADGMGRLCSVEGDERYHDLILKPEGGRAVSFAGKGGSPGFRAFAARTLAEAPELSKATRAMVRADGEEDGVFVTLCEPDELLWLNYAQKAVRKGDLALPPLSIGSQRVPR